MTIPLTAQKTAEELHKNRETVRLILTEALKIKKACSKMVPKNLSSKKQMKIGESFADLSARLFAEPNLW